ncbi:MAG: hypothetical protein K1X28_02820 [Parachlamydiales bacterium]|nr:hypothetical protein [Parachlamydiales bacterium]
MASISNLKFTETAQKWINDPLASGPIDRAPPAAQQSFFGEIRRRDLESACRKTGLPNPAETVEDQALLTDVFNSWRNLNLDTLPLFLAFSIHGDLNHCEEHLARTPEYPKKTADKKALASFHANFCRVCMKSFQDLSAEMLYDNPNWEKIGKIREDFCAQLTKIQKLLSLIPRSSQVGEIQQKLEFWLRIASQPTYPQLAALNFVVMGTRERQKTHEEELKLRSKAAKELRQAPSIERAAETAQQYPAAAAAIRTPIQEQVAQMPTLEETVSLLLGEVEFELPHYQELSAELEKQKQLLHETAEKDQNYAFRLQMQKVADLEAMIQKLEDPGTYLARVQRSLREIREAPPEQRISLAGTLIEELEEKKMKIIENREGGMTVIEGALSKQFFHLLHRMTSSLAVYTKNLSLRLTALRLHCNLQAHLDIPRTILTLDGNQKLKERFFALHQFMEKKIQWQKPFEKLDNSFSSDNWQELQTFCRQNRFKTFMPAEFLTKFQKLHKHYSEIASKLYRAGDLKGAAALKSDYFNLCSILLPTFFSNLDIESLRIGVSSERDIIIPDELLICFDLEIDESEEEVGPLKEIYNESSDEEPEEHLPSPAPMIDPSPRQILSPTPIIAPSPRPLPPPPGPVNPAPRAKPTVQAPQPVREKPAFSRREIPKKVRKLRQWIRERFHETEGGRHRKIVDDDGKQISVMSRSGKASRRGVPRGTFNAMTKQLTQEQ